ncbi:hypothetical protein AYI69_g4916 [Smittium culicis]|uniref:Uncharacterized protein n=1 Tax=Smittium culicis TaxID=133412 RepID=A0A1R1Y9H2_9FUNG|nr:hypothetical protein AYI69_g4916 [Smittium culicis]
MEALGVIDVYQFQRSINDLKCSASSEFIWTFGSDIFGQHYLSGISLKILKYYVSQIAGNTGADLVTLPKDQHPPTIQSEWSIMKEIFVFLNYLFGHVDVDIFASHLYKNMGAYYSWFPDTSARKYNELAFNWSEWSNPYACPPWNLISQVIQKVRWERLTQTLITPLWKSDIWFPGLNDFSVSQPLFLQLTTVAPDPQRGKLPLTENKHWSLMVWWISGVLSKSKVSRILPLIFSFPKNNVDYVGHVTIIYKNVF